jgi:hypothetical protein
MAHTLSTGQNLGTTTTTSSYSHGHDAVWVTLAAHGTYVITQHVRHFVEPVSALLQNTRYPVPTGFLLQRSIKYDRQGSQTVYLNGDKNGAKLTDWPQTCNKPATSCL